MSIASLPISNIKVILIYRLSKWFNKYIDKSDTTTINCMPFNVHWGNRIWCRFILFHIYRKLLIAIRCNLTHRLQQHEYHYDLMPHFSLKYQLLGLHLSLNRISKLDCCDQLGLCWRVWSPVLNLLRIIIYPSEVEKDRCLFCWLLICLFLKSIPAFYPFFLSTMIWSPLN